MQKSVSIFLLFCMLFVLSSCRQKVVIPEEGYQATGAVTDIMRTHSFDFTVLSVKEARDYYTILTPSKDEKFLVAEILISNTSSEAVAMFDTDFQLQWGANGFSDTVGYAHKSMAPVEQVLEPGQTVQWFYVFISPEYVNAFTICYIDNKHLMSDSLLTPNAFYVDFTT